MWGLGHTSIPYLFIRPGLKKTQVRIDPRFVVLILAFSNLPDIIHFSGIRFLSHNPAGTVIISYLFVRFFRKHDMINQTEGVVLFLCGLSHGLLDTLWGSYYLFFPFSFPGEVKFLGFSKPISKVIETLGFIGFIFIMFITRDFEECHKYSKEQIRKGIKLLFPLSEKLDNWRENISELLMPVTIGGLGIFLILQFFTMLLAYTDDLLAGNLINSIHLIYFGWFSYVTYHILGIEELKHIFQQTG